ncbi:MAG: efflux RND transporter permease subunit [Spirochaetes bacterium]|nr:efflux RND transporter permease subunit [Spirochaetota bacterium]
MKRMIEFLITQKLLIGLVIVLLCAVGIYSAFTINREAFPEVNFDMVSIRTVYPGGAPDDLEQLITVPIEKKLREVGGLDKVRSYNIENVSVVVAYIDDTVSDKGRVVQDIRDAVDLVNNLPAGTLPPVVEEITTDTLPAIDVAVYGKKPGVPYHDIRETANELEEFFYGMKGVAEVEFFGYDDREFLVEVNPDAMRKYRVGMNTVINALKQRNVDLPGGSLRIGDTEYVLRTKGQFKNAGEIEDTVIIGNDAGYVVRIRDMAKVTAAYEDPDVYERFNGRGAVIMRIWRQSSADEIRLVDQLRHALASYRSSISPDVTFAIFNDTSRYSRESLDRVMSNAASGFILLALIMMLLMGWRMSGLVTACIPIIIMMAIIGMKMLGHTFNVITLFAMVMVLGMIVDFGIVVSENTHRYIESGCEKREAIVKGVKEVFWPVTVTLLCLSAAFSPLLMLSGLMGKFIIGIPVVLIICLVSSWAIAMFVMPMLLDVFAKTNGAASCEDGIRREDPNYEQGIFGKFQRGYKRFLRWSLMHRYITMGVLVALLLGSLVLAALIGFTFTPPGGEETLTIRTTMPQETNLQANLADMRIIEGIIARLPRKELDNFQTSVGRRVTDFLDPAPGQATHKSTFSIYLTSVKKRSRSADEIIASLRDSITKVQKSGGINRDTLIEYEVERNGPPIGKPINVEIRGKDFEVLKKIASEYITYLKGIPGVQDIRLDLEDGKKEYRFVVDEVTAARSGISVYDVAVSINACFEGAVATYVTRNEENVDIRVRFPEEARRKMQSLDEVMIANRTGGLIPLGRVARIDKQPGFTAINRLDLKRIVQVQAGVDLDKTTSIAVNKDLMEHFGGIEERYPGYEVSYGGEQEETEERLGELGVLFLFALFIIYIILAVFFKSLVIPVVVMIAIPFALVGMVFALFVHGQQMSFMSMLGFFSLAGVIVSNTLVLVQFINNMRATGLGLQDALVEAGVVRIRPILLTAGTTVLGLIPSIYGLGGKDYMVAPLALSFGYGLIFATFITLVLVPGFYHIAEDLKSAVSRLLARAGIMMGSTLYAPAGPYGGTAAVDPLPYQGDPRTEEHRGGDAGAEERRPSPGRRGTRRR